MSGNWEYEMYETNKNTISIFQKSLDCKLEAEILIHNALYYMYVKSLVNYIVFEYTFKMLEK